MVEEGELFPGQDALAVIDAARRDATRRHHTGTHLLHSALRQVLGDHVRQQGSLVAPDRLRFDFSHPKALRPEELTEVTEAANADVLTDAPVEVIETSKAEAEALGALAFFDDKYGERVRVVRAGAHSLEFCGGTHVDALGMIGPITVVSEGSIGSNIRRIEAVTGAELPGPAGREPAHPRRGGPAAQGGARRRARRLAEGARPPAPGREGVAAPARGPPARRCGAASPSWPTTVWSSIARTACTPTSCATWPRPSGATAPGWWWWRGRRTGPRWAWPWRRVTDRSTPVPRPRSWPSWSGGGGGGSAELAVAGGSDPAKIDTLLAEARRRLGA